MTEDDARALIREAITPDSVRWADLGAGTGTFTRALAGIVGANGEVVAIERDAAARRKLDRSVGATERDSARIRSIDGDFTKPLSIDALDGILMANALHFVRYANQAAVLAQLGRCLRASGRLVVVEYDREDGNQWVPYPVSLRKFVALCSAAGFAEPIEVGRMASAFGGSMYAAWTTPDHSAGTVGPSLSQV